MRIQNMRGRSSTVDDASSSMIVIFDVQSLERLILRCLTDINLFVNSVSWISILNKWDRQLSFP